jgi:hypothetical protein
MRFFARYSANEWYRERLSLLTRGERRWPGDRTYMVRHCRTKCMCRAWRGDSAKGKATPLLSNADARKQSRGKWNRVLFDRRANRSRCSLAFVPRDDHRRASPLLFDLEFLRYRGTSMTIFQDSICLVSCQAGDQHVRGGGWHKAAG